MFMHNKRLQYTVRVSVSSSKSSTVVGSADKSFELAPGKSVKVSLPEVATSTAKGLVCIPAVTKEAAER